MRAALLTALFTGTCFAAIAQQAPYSAKQRFFYVPASATSEGITIEISDALGELTVSKFRIKVINKTGDYLFVDPSRFNYRMGDAVAHFKEKPFVVRPFDDAARTLDAYGASTYQHESPVLDFADGLQLAPGMGRVTRLEDFSLPASVNSMQSGPFTVNLKDLSKKTDKTHARFTVQYTGKALGVVDPSRISVKLPSGQAFANEKSKSKPVLLEAGGTDDFSVVAEIPAKIADMQFTTLTVAWNDAFSETAKGPFSMEALRIAVDQERTKKAN
ncbi:MAG TPA: hypothetical protein PKY96_14165 [Flavobacteriales bacterium]|nr:hypothetical protein [Flavobacteriales bacterium]